MRYISSLPTILFLLLALLGSTPVLSEQVCNEAIPATAPNGRYVIHGDGTVTDGLTGLMWKRCAEGLSGPDCSTGTEEVHTWQQALELAFLSDFAGYTDWRLPNLKELSSLVERRCYDPAININSFPNTPSWVFWSASLGAFITGNAWYLNFGYGYGNGNYKSDDYHVRLVRGGQRFELLSLSVSVTGSGTVTGSRREITCPGICSATYTEATPVTLTATPADGWQFTGWGGACTGIADCFLTVDSPLSVTANFTETTTPSYSLSISKSGKGAIISEPAGIDCGSDCSETYDSGTVVTLTPTPETDWQFVAWNGVCAGAGSTCTLTLDADQSVMATFTRQSEVSDLPVATVPLGSNNDQIDVTGTAEFTTRYLDFGGSDTFTLSPDLAGPVKLIDRQATRIILPVGLTIQRAEFVSDGARFTINGHAVTLLGNVSDFIFVFAGDAADPNAGFSRRFAETATFFGASIPLPGAGPALGSLVGTIASDGDIIP